MSTILETAKDLGQEVYTKTESDTITNGKVTKIATSTDNAIVRFDGTSGQVQNSSVVIDDSGNVGIGVTPSAWGSSNKSIQLGYGSAVFGNTGLALTGVGCNFYNDGTNDKYLTNTYATQYFQLAGAHYWFNAPSGTAGNNVTFTQAMTLGTSGNLLVGTTTDNGVDKLQVNGSISATNLFGQGQTWQDVTASRSIGVTYTNTTGKPIFVSVTGYNWSSSAFYIGINGVLRAMKQGSGSANVQASLTFIVPNGNTYVMSVANSSISSWHELR